MPAPRMRDISISRAKPAIRLTMVSPPIVPVDLTRFIGLPSLFRLVGSGLARAFARFVRLVLARRAAGLRLFALLPLHLRKVSSSEVDRLQEEGREAHVLDRLANDLAREG